MYAKKTLTIRGLKKRKIRAKVSGTSDRLRLSVFRSNKFLTAQLIDDSKGITVGAARAVRNQAGAKELGKAIAGASKVKDVVFDRNGFLYHGLIRLVADSARENGLKF